MLYNDPRSRARMVGYLGQLKGMTIVEAEITDEGHPCLHLQDEKGRVRYLTLYSGPEGNDAGFPDISPLHKSK